jgi:hypothetical protein
LDCWRWFKEALGSGVYKDPPQVRLLLLHFLAFGFVHPAQALLNSTRQLLARDRGAVAQCAELGPREIRGQVLNLGVARSLLTIE